MNYSRQDSFLSEQLQTKINSKEFYNKELTIVGCGGIGSPLAQLLIRGGFTKLILIDSDVVDETNLQRQTFFEKDIGKPKVQALKQQLELISKVQIREHVEMLTTENINEICSNSDLIIDATDNFETRKLINEYCESKSKTWIYNGAVKAEIMCCIFKGENKKFNKIFNKSVNDEMSCSMGVLGSTTFISASICYNEILKFFLTNHQSQLIKYNIWNQSLIKVNI